MDYIVAHLVEYARGSGLVNIWTPDEAIERLAGVQQATPLQRFLFLTCGAHPST
jgi:hypothetical protein